MALSAVDLLSSNVLMLSVTFSKANALLAADFHVYTW